MSYFSITWRWWLYFSSVPFIVIIRLLCSIFEFLRGWHVCYSKDFITEYTNMGTQITGTGRKRIPNRERLTAEDDALNQIAREVRFGIWFSFLFWEAMLVILRQTYSTECLQFKPILYILCQHKDTSMSIILVKYSLDQTFPTWGSRTPGGTWPIHRGYLRRLLRL